MLISDRSGIKSIPLNSLPADAWTSIIGSNVNGEINPNDAIQRYQDVAWVNRAVNLIADAVSSVPYCFYEKRIEQGGIDSEETEPEEVEPQFPFELDLPRFLNEIAGDLTLYPGAYFFKGKNFIRRVKEVRRLHPSTIKPEYDNEQGLVGFRRSVGSGTGMVYSPDEIGWIWRPNRKTEIGGGDPPIYAALAAAGALHAQDKLINNLYENGMMDVTLISIEGQTSAPDRERLQSWITRMVTGVRNAFTANVMGGGKLSSVKLNSELSETVAIKLTDKKREDICTAFGIPQTLLFSNAANYATAHQDDLHFYDKTIIPLCAMIAGSLNKHLFEPLGYCLEFKPKRLEMYQALEAEKGGKLVILKNAGILMPNEAREELGYEEIDGLDEVWLDKYTVIHAQPALLANAQAPVEAGSGDARMKPDQESVSTGEAGLESMQEDMQKWLRMATKRYKEGKPARALDFESEHIPPVLQSSIKGALESVRDVKQLAAVFEEASHWDDYYHVH